MADGIVTAFRALGRDERLQALHGIVDVLTLNERKAVTSAISKRNDLVNQLPFELTLQIFTHLHPLDTWSLRSVSRQWNTLLSASEFEWSAVKRWNSQSDAGRVKPAGERTLEYEIRHIQAHQTGRPFSWKRLERGGAGAGASQLKGRYLVSNTGPSVLLTDLCSGAIENYVDEARDNLRHVVSTSEILAFTAFSGCLYWKPVRERRGDLRKLQLPSANIRVAAGDRHFVVLFAAPWFPPGPTQGTGDMIVFDASTSHADLVTIDDQLKTMSGPGCQLTVNAEQQTVSLFYAPTDDPHGPETCIEHFRISLQGAVLAHHVLHCKHRFCRGSIFLRAPLYAGRDGLYTLQLATEADPAELLWTSTFDTVAGNLVDVLSPSPEQQSGTEFVVWKDSVFRPLLPLTTQDHATGTFWRSVPTSHEELRFVLITAKSVPSTSLTRSRYQRSGKHMLNSEQGADPVDAKPNLHCHLMLVNDSFLVAIESDREQRWFASVFCFEEDVHMFDGLSTGWWD